MLSTGTAMFPKDVIESLGKDQEIGAEPERETSDHIFSLRHGSNELDSS